MTRPVTTASWATTAFATSSRSAVSAARGSAGCLLLRRAVGLTRHPPPGCRSWCADRSLQLVQAAAQMEQRTVVLRGRTVEQLLHVAAGATRLPRSRCDDRTRCGVAAETEQVLQPGDAGATQCSCR